MELPVAWAVGILIASAGGLLIYFELERREKLRHVPRSPMQQQPMQQQSKSRDDK